jgi:FkbM family methyltransferase
MDKHYLRTLQTHFPFLHDLRFRLKLGLMGLRGRPHEPDFYFLQQFQPAAHEVLVDIGANRGESILSMRLMAGETTPIVAFEPHPLIFSKLEQRFARSPKVQLFNYGLAQQPGEQTLYTPFYRQWMFDGLTSFDYEAARNWLPGRLWGFDHRKLSIHSTTCQTQTLDSFQLAPAFIKIDVQGYETQVLQGARDTLRRHKPVLLIESLQDEQKALLNPLGYQYFHFQKGQLLPGKGALNTFCVPPNRL